MKDSRASKHSAWDTQNHTVSEALDPCDGSCRDRAGVILCCTAFLECARSVSSTVLLAGFSL